MSEETRRKFLGVMAFLTALVLLWWVCSSIAEGAERIRAEVYFGKDFFPREQREAYENSSGSCVYMSVAAAGIYQNVPLAWTLPWDTEYGEACRGGSTPTRFERDAKSRGLLALSVTGTQTYDWMKWGIRNGRWVAIGAGRQHFQTLVGHNPENDTWDVWNCNDYHVVTRYTDAEFRRLHEACGHWCILLLDYPSMPRPKEMNVIEKEEEEKK